MRTTEDRHLVLLAQEALKARGIDPGPLDGLWGGRTEKAFAQFRRTHAFATAPKDGPVNVHPGEPAWLRIARAEVGVAEIPGAKDNPRIVEYHQACTLHATDDETPWCSSFVNWVMAQAGIAGTRNAMARSWLQWGSPLAEPRVGCVAVFKRGSYPSGHVGFYLGENAGSVSVLGGNQGNRVSISTSQRADLLGYRWPNAGPA